MLGLYEANDLSPMLDLQLGEKVYPVPPLTLARFLKLSACDWQAMLTELLGSNAPAMMAEADPEDPVAFAKKLGVALVDFPHAPFAEVVAAIVPGASAAEWIEHGDALKLMLIYHAFGKTHDWTLISDAIGFGKPVEKEATGRTVAGALMLFCQNFPFYKPEDLLAMRVDFFFLIRQGVAEPREDETEGVPEAVYVHAPDSPLWAALDAADRKAGVN